jgi:hypothetical protein
MSAKDLKKQVSFSVQATRYLLKNESRQLLNIIQPLKDTLPPGVKQPENDVPNPKQGPS